MSDAITPERLEAAYQTVLRALLQERHPDGYWVGELSTSALSTATAVMALYLMQRHAGPATSNVAGGAEWPRLIEGGLRWLAEHQNDDGGWGDTTISYSNISTTMLCRAAFHLTGAAERFAATVKSGEEWLFSRYGGTPAELAEAVRARYGKDRTFAVPILTTCALAGLVDWREVPPLPFELAVFPQSWFRFLRLHVVSYALPALIAIGICIFKHRRSWNPFSLVVRILSRQRAMRVLTRIQPSNGGFLEATPLTSFVTLSLAASGFADHEVARRGIGFIVNSVRPDGSWPIDTNLSTWVTTLSINALAAADELKNLDRLPDLADWLVRQQYRARHPYTDAAPGGWAWTPLPGGVPDADDTPGAVLALRHLQDLRCRQHEAFENAVAAGRHWLRGLQNRDGGWPTFCRGWGHLPFDRSGPDLTAHAVRCLSAPRSDLGFEAAVENGFAYLARTQRPDSSWLPLWFGNQHAPDDENPVYGTARVLAAYRDLGRLGNEARRGIQFLIAVQNADGGWGGAQNTPSSMEETALALEILLDADLPSDPSLHRARERGLRWLVEQVEQGNFSRPSPIGFYFAKLWYFERLYPIIFTVAALGRARGQQGTRHSPDAKPLIKPNKM